MTTEMILIPVPRKIEPIAGALTLEDGRFIVLDADDPQALMPAGRAVQAALETLGTRWELTAARGADPARLGVVIRVDPPLVGRPQGYRLTIAPRRITLLASDPAGAFYAAMTLRQIVRQTPRGGPIACLRIEDWPDFPHRGVMLDISRDKVPTMETLFGMVDLLAELKVNEFQLYTEHTFAYRNHRVVWEKASPMTGEEVLALDAYCRERFVELVPNQNSFGHMNRWLGHAAYNHLAETPAGFEFPWGGRSHSPFSLSPAEPGALALLQEMYDELLPHFSSRMFNVGCDETWDLGQGKSHEACEKRGTGRVYLDFLLKIHEEVRRRGKTMQFWGDIIMKHPELIPELPDDLIALEWGYEADHPFAEHGEKFARAGISFYVCPGTSSWNAIVGRTDNAVGNLRNAAENGLRNGAVGYLNTDWGDNGHWQPLPVCYLGYAYGAAESWSAEASRDIDLPRALSTHVFLDKAGVMGRLAYDLGNAYLQAEIPMQNSSPLWGILINPDHPMKEGWFEKLVLLKLERSQAYISRVMAELPKARMDRPDAALVRDEFECAAGMCLHACKLGMARLVADGGEIAKIDPKVLKSLREDIARIIHEHERVWLARNRPGGLPDSVARLRKVLARYEG